MVFTPLGATYHCDCVPRLEWLRDRPANGGAGTYHRLGYRRRGEIGSRNETHSWTVTIKQAPNAIPRLRGSTPSSWFHVPSPISGKQTFVFRRILWIMPCEVPPSRRRRFSDRNQPGVPPIRNFFVRAVQKPRFRERYGSRASSARPGSGSTRLKTASIWKFLSDCKYACQSSWPFRI